MVGDAVQARRLAGMGHGRMAGFVAPAGSSAEVEVLACWGAFIRWSTTARPGRDGLNAWIHDTEQSWTVLSAIGGGRTVATQGGPAA